MSFPGSTSGKEPACQCRRLKRSWFDPWVRKIPWRKGWQPTPVFLPGKSHGQRGLACCDSWGCRVGHDWATELNWTEGCLRASQVVLVLKNLPANVGDIRDVSLIPESRRSLGGWHDNPLQYSCLENPMVRGAWQAAVYRVSQSQIQLKWLSTHTRYPGTML